ncbi:cytochrome C biogenesis protein [Parvibaculum lavamentivorans DS-1]|uniref:Cytochrome c-type biogenesis protein n=1 Tax=Parvibaculum lavamentivorans (strain DS-1 / DSM 13023 / NCIMB 13966) TaxID=402881 RepID=A7HRN2_PARL1|nr:cytochrome c-type biogenesis protein [Parvibaculum lavamentivorans]ABS62565.1 cytochrome C biogenesis protein [Parvibaculum lavamentivorans DS-1]
MFRWVTVLFLVLALAAPAHAAIDPGERLADPALEARARDLSKELRCLVCQNQSIDDSDAELAQDLRRLVRQRLAAGDSNAEVLDYVVERYGEFVLMTPRFKPSTWVLWLGPLSVLLVGGGTVFLVLHRHRGRRADPALTSEEAARVAALMDERKLNG